MPRNPGHTMIVPKKHYRWVWDIKEDYSKPTNKVAAALKKAFNTDYIVSFVMGDEVPHAHIHILPQTSEGIQGIKFTEVIKMEKEEIGKLAENIQNSF